MIKIDVGLIVACFSLVTAISSVIGYFFGVKFRLQSVEKRVELLEIKEIPDFKQAMQKHFESHILNDREIQQKLSDIDTSIKLLIQRFELTVEK